MGHRASLTEYQLAVLGWIGDGCPDGVMEGYAHRVSAAALRARELVRTSGRGRGWTAELTDSGREYLERAAGPDAARPRQANVSVTQQLVDDVVAGGGSLLVPRRRWPDRGAVDYENRARLAERHGKVPEGKRLVVEGASEDELRIKLVDAPHVGSAQPVPVPERVTRYHPVARQLKQARERHEVSRPALPRAMRLLHALIVEAERRGHDVRLASPSKPDGYGREAWSGGRDGHLVISVDGCSAAVRVKEVGLQSRAHWERQNRTSSYGLGGEMRSRLPALAEYEAGATGRLELEIVSGYGGPGRPVKWGDRRSWTLEEKLPELLHELEIRAVERDARERQAELEAAEREAAWEAAVRRARVRHAEHHREEVLRAELARWADAQAIRAYCDSAEAGYPDSTKALEWIAWARRYADELDPLAVAPGMPPAPETVSPDELRPYLEGWDPYGPTRRRW